MSAVCVDSTVVGEALGFVPRPYVGAEHALAAPFAPKVPQSVVDKFEVETYTSTTEELIAQKIASLTDKEQAFYIVDLSKVVDKYKLWVQCFPRVKPYYAMKCNPNLAVIKTLAGCGANFDCASKAEIQTILGMGVGPERIIYANPTKMKSHIEFAKASRVEMMTFDNADELIKISQVYPNAKLVLRIITDDSNSVCRFSTKFGAPLSVVPKLLSLAKELGINLHGVSFHVGSGCMSVQSFAAAVRSAHGVFEQAAAMGMPMRFLDLGGGWPGTDHDPVRFTDIADCVRPLLDELFPPEVEIISEPGRYFVCESHTLVTNVFARREMENEDGSKSYLYYINDGVYQSFNCIFFDHAGPQPVIVAPQADRPLAKCTIFGPTCDSMDCIARDIVLPELRVGEFLYFKAMGAYTVAAASPFNGFDSCPETFYYARPTDV
jgi:ornithine decarboxylase